MNNISGPEIAKRIRALCSARGIPVKRFEQDCNLSNGYLRKLSVQQSTPSAARLQRIAEYFSTTTEFLIGGDAPMQKGAASVKIPLLGRVAAGLPLEIFEEIIGFEEIPASLTSSGEYFALLINGDSMEPYIMNKDRVVVRRQNDAETNEIVVALIDGNDGVCKRLKKIKDGLMLISLNTKYEPLVFTDAEIDNELVRIVGKVVEIRRDV